jgi:hypothetical protein
MLLGGVEYLEEGPTRQREVPEEPKDEEGRRIGF